MCVAVVAGAYVAFVTVDIEGYGLVSVGLTEDVGFDASVGHEVLKLIAVGHLVGNEMLGVR